MKNIEAIKWNLYCLKGWEEANLKLTQLLEQEIQTLNIPFNGDKTLYPEAAKTVWKKMIEHFKKPEFKHFGTTDSDVEMALREALKHTFDIWLDEKQTYQL